MQRERLVIIGAGMAGSKLASTLLEKQGDRYEITLIGEEEKAGYNRIMLSSLLADEITEDGVALVDIPAMQEAGLMLITNDPAIDISMERKVIRLASQQEVAFDKLIFATGSRASILPIKGNTAANVMGFRTWQDVQTLANLPANSTVCVIGGGLLGLEAAVGLVKRGHKVTLVHRSGHILNRQLDVSAAGLLQKTLEQMGVEFRLGATPVECRSRTESTEESGLDSQQVEAVLLSSGEVIPASLVIMAAGITPEASLAQQSGIEVNRAIQVNTYMETSIEGVFALGECCEYEGQTFGLVAPIWQQLNTLVDRLSGTDNGFHIEPTPTKLKVSGVQLFSVGEIDASDGAQSITYMDEAQQIYRKLVVKEGRLMGAILYGNVADGNWYFQLIQNQTQITDQLDQIIFGEAYCHFELGNAKVALSIASGE